MLKAKDIVKSYRQPSSELKILKGINLELNQGDVLSIIGPSGAGKSTLLHILGGLDEPTQGSVLLDGENIYSLNEHKRAKVRNQKIGFVFQFYHLLPEFTALENVFLPAMVSPQGSFESMHDKARDLLKRVGLERRMEHRPNELSGGEQQRVAIARALINEPKVIFCDEPTGNLDSANSQVIMNLLLDLNRQSHQTLVIVTHDEDVASKSTSVIHIRDGVIDSKGVKNLAN